LNNFIEYVIDCIGGFEVNGLHKAFDQLVNMGTKKLSEELIKGGLGYI
jgi:hypothetical protein